MVKLVGLLKRRPGMSTDEFRAYYETHHKKLGDRYLAGFADRYLRRYLNPFPDPAHRRACGAGV